MGLDEAVNSTTEITETNKSTARVLRASLPFKSPRTSHPSLSSTILGLLPRREALVEEAAPSSADVDEEGVTNEADEALFSGWADEEGSKGTMISVAVGGAVVEDLGGRITTSHNATETRRLPFDLIGRC